MLLYHIMLFGVAWAKLSSSVRGELPAARQRRRVEAVAARECGLEDTRHDTTA